MNLSPSTRASLPGRFIPLVKFAPLSLLLLPLFFVLHGVNNNIGSVSATDASLLVLSYIAASFLVAGISWLAYKDLPKACLFTLLMMAYQYFFGSLQDLLKTLPSPFFSQYRFVLPASLLLFTAIAVLLKKRKSPLHSLIRYLNLLLFILVLIECVSLLSKTFHRKDQPTLTVSLTSCDSCQKPDIYLILLDQYAGHTALKEMFDFDNSRFEQALQQRGFYVVPQSSSNYNLTPFSMASALDMDYLSEEMGEKGNLNVGYTYRAIRQNKVVHLLKKQGYRFYNLSIFDFPGQPALEYGALLPYGTKLITLQTFTGRLTRDFRLAILEGKLGFTSLRKKFAFQYLQFNNTILARTKRLAQESSSSPRFVYAHLMLPHFPYYFNSRGEPVPMEKLGSFYNTNSADYIEYLQYGNQKILHLVDDMLADSQQPPVIMLLSDHGFRYPGNETDRKHDFTNLNAIFLPNKNYRGFYEGMTNVNHFRVFFNTQFGQHWPLLKDSTIDLRMD